MGEEVKYKIDWKTLDNIYSFHAEYNEETDILYMQSKEQRPAVSIDCDGVFWCRIDPMTGEILGIEIEDFQRIYLKNHPDLVREIVGNVRPIAESIRIASCPA